MLIHVWVHTHVFMHIGLYMYILVYTCNHTLIKAMYLIYINKSNVI